ncbi:hypothetical protein [Cohnella candidum]|uniref:Uncharacterized protein n=1 Tax=Cohnella candidum TaxID=2674991 RepID=A0A3G3JV26_9BACL|nr:hypothetical protein [Cohnella candidum]AYQ72092.1 hypothetical protein EAV92_05615 [Cohnella candidum]
MTSNELFNLLKTEIHSILFLSGYEIIEEQYPPEFFGSRYITFSNANSVIRLVWDGKESYFILEEYIGFNEILKINEWSDIETMKYVKEEVDDKYIENFINQFIASLLKSTNN